MRSQRRPRPTETSDRTGPLDCRPAGCAALCTAEGLAAAYRTWRDVLLGRARAILGDPALAEDAVQETFVRAWRACAQFDPDGPPMLHWLTVIMRNVALDMLRARGRRPAVVDTDLLDVVAAPALGAGEIDAMLVRTVLRRALTGIGRHHRNAIEQTILLDRPYDTVAAELGVPVGTLRSRVHHGLRRLRTILETAEDGSPTPCAA